MYAFHWSLPQEYIITTNEVSGAHDNQWVEVSVIVDNSLSSDFHSSQSFVCR